MRVGVDVGGSLTKIAIDDDGARLYRLLEHTDPDRVAAWLPQAASVYATGCGARELASRLKSPVKVLDELDCFCAGARQLAREQGLGERLFVLTSMGTGTSVFRVTGESGASAGTRADSSDDNRDDTGPDSEAGARCGTRVTGTGVGGGTITGLGSLLLSTGDFAQIMSLASAGQRQRVDLMVSDLYRNAAESPVLNALTAANFGRGGFCGAGEADIASAIVQLVVEVVAVLSIQAARTHEARTIVLAGSPISHPHIRYRFVEIGQHLGHQFAFLENGAFCGALGAVL